MIKELSDLTKVDQKNITHVLSEKFIKRNRFKKRVPTEIENEEIENCFSTKKQLAITMSIAGSFFE